MTMTINEIREAIYKEFATNWQPDGCPFWLENEKADAVDGEWSRFAVRFLDRGQVSMGPPGARRYDSQGIAFQQLFTPIDRGMAAIDGFTEQALRLFDSRRIEGTTIRFNAARSREIGPSAQERYFQVLVETGFVFEAQE